MNIAAVVAALDIDDLDPAAKLVVVAVASHAKRDKLTVRVSIDRLARDASLSYSATWRALHRAVDGGWLTVENNDGRCLIWRLCSRADAHSDIAPARSQISRQRALRHRASAHLKKDLRDKEIRTSARARSKASARACGNPPPDVPPLPPQAQEIADALQVLAGVQRDVLEEVQKRRAPAGMPPDVAEAGRAVLKRLK